VRTGRSPRYGVARHGDGTGLSGVCQVYGTTGASRWWLRPAVCDVSRSIDLESQVAFGEVRVNGSEGSSAMAGRVSASCG
jgi:hypothetical protein